MMKKTVKTQQNFPFVSAIAAVLLITYLFTLVIKDQVALVNDFLIKVPVLSQNYFSISMLVVFSLLLIFDMQRFQRQKKQVKKNTDKLKQEITDVWESKKHLQNKAHTYSGHADKLKLFISDKLLEYIEYDEKFLHFKGIAAEVRHNGVISYDIVTTLLQQRIKQFESQPEGDAAMLNQYSHALAAMRYLWDLLDLSTADNISLHIANQLIQCEEQFYQISLQQDELADELLGLVVAPDFSSLDAVSASLTNLVHEPDQLISYEIAKPTFENESLENKSSKVWQFNDDQFDIQLHTNQHLLGNTNHIRLILENLLKNAQHFSRKVAFKQKSDRILVSLIEGSGYIDYQVYNRGPHIEEDDKEKLFQLGFSTRRTKEHHGKGLGLFFVNEIVKGYEGQISVNNIHNREANYSIRIALANGDIETKVVMVKVEDKLAEIIDAGDENTIVGEKKNTIRWQYSSAIESVEISSNITPETRVINGLADGKEKKSYLDISHKDSGKQQGAITVPSWSLELQPKYRTNKTYNVQFNILDIAGVCFSIKLPTAEARLEGLDPDWLD